MTEIVGSLSLDQLRAAMRDQGVRRLYVKFLSPNDNSKNQIYLGGDLSVVNVLPAAEPTPAVSGSHAEPIFKAAMTFSWIDDSGAVHAAPGAQLILYPQYPEVRFSGFLRAATAAPSRLLSSRDAGRLLLIGIGSEGQVFGYAAEGESTIGRALRALSLTESVGVLRAVPIGAGMADSKTRLLAELCRIHQAGAIDAWRLGSDGSRGRCNGTNCVGVTLESELGIVANGRSEPDFDGWEVKGHLISSLTSKASGTLTLLTPEPDRGVYVEDGVELFVRRYGYPDKRGRPNRLNFGGVHVVGTPHNSTRLTLTLRGFDAASSTLTNSSGALELTDGEGTVAAGWSFSKLLAHWQRKHARAAYVPGVRVSRAPEQYQYSGSVLLCEGTDFVRLLSSLAAGLVYYDPGIKLENENGDPVVKRRSQIRVRKRDLSSLYASITKTNSCDSVH